jgi:hypothetical protein
MSRRNGRVCEGSFCRGEFIIVREGIGMEERRRTYEGRNRIERGKGREKVRAYVLERD